MTLRHSLALATALALAAGGALQAQQTEAATPPDSSSLSEAVEEAGQNMGQVDDILASEEQMLAGEGYYYDPGNRRDPFRSLLAQRVGPTMRGPRPEGIPGLLIDEIDLTGIFLMADGPAAQVMSADRNQSFLLREGAKVYDGDVIRITSEEVVFRQAVDDPTAIKPFREVVKRLYQ